MVVESLATKPIILVTNTEVLAVFKPGDVVFLDVTSVVDAGVQK